MRGSTLTWTSLHAEFPSQSVNASRGLPSSAASQVANDNDVRLMFKQVQGEVPGSPIFAMKLAPQSRHLEVQLMCDMCVPPTA